MVIRICEKERSESTLVYEHGGGGGGIGERVRGEEEKRRRVEGKGSQGRSGYYRRSRSVDRGVYWLCYYML